jgi:GNAT superfamily N-acetyltransferase
MNTIANTIEIFTYDHRYAEAFKRLNIAWLEKYFSIEPADEIVWNDPQGNIIGKGGLIFFIKVNEQIAGTAALLKIADATYELAKMAVDEKFQGRQLGQMLLDHCIKAAQELGASRLILFSNRKLLPALHLYNKHGFKEVAMEHSVYKRSDIKMELILK